MKVIQDLQIIEVPGHFKKCTCCRKWVSNKEGDGPYFCWTCKTCASLSSEERKVKEAESREQERCHRYYHLSAELNIYNNVVVGGVTVGKLIEHLSTLDKDAYVTQTYDDPEDGLVYLVPNLDADENKVLGTKYYVI